MSNPSSSPASRPLEQLKVTELREELRKRGLSLKGVKKELFERLDAAVKEEQSGAPLGGAEGTGDHVSFDQGSMAQDTADHQGPEADQEENPDESLLGSKDAALIVDNASPYVGASDATPVIKEMDKDTETLEPVFEDSEDAGGNNIGQEAVSMNAGGDIQEAPVVFVNQVTGNNVSLNESMEDDSAFPESGDKAIKDEAAHIFPESQSQDGQTDVGPKVVAVPEDSDGKDSPDGENIVLVQESGLSGIVSESDLSGVVSQSVGDKGVDNVSITDKYPSLADAGIPAMDNAVVANDYPVEDVKIFEKINLTSVSVAPCVQEQVEDEVGVSCMAETSIPRPEGMKQNESQVLMLTSEDKAVIETPDVSQVPVAVKEYVVVDVAEDITVLEEPTDVTADTVMLEVAQNVVKLKQNQDVSMSESEEGLNADNKTLVDSMEELAPMVDNVKHEELSIPEPADSERAFESASGRAPDKVSPPKVESQSQEERGSMGVKSERQESKEKLPRAGKPIEKTLPRDIDYDRCKHESTSGIKYGEERNRAHGRAGRVFKEERTGIKETDLKPEKDRSHLQSSQKRKEEEDAKQQEPAKRVRRWNSGNQRAAETAKPLTTGTVKEIMSPEVKKEGLAAIAPKLPLKTLGQARSFPTAAKADPDANGDKRAVPPSTRPPSNSLKIERFVRPFTLNAVKDMLAAFGNCVDFWMDQIKTHCYVTFTKVDEAVAARNALYGKQWPPSFGNHLVADFVDASEVKIRCDGSFEKGNAAPPVTPRGAPNPPPAPATHLSASSNHGHANTLASAPPLRERPPMQPTSLKQPEPPVPTLDDLFRKTRAKPHIYYLPLTDEQVAAKLAAAKNKELQSKSRPVGRA